MRHKRRTQRGQSIVEYTSVIAFVCCVIAMAFAIAQGSLFAGISNSYSGVSATLDATNRAAAGHP
jgi:Flp pilus assembly pilin Flp